MIELSIPLSEGAPLPFFDVQYVLDAVTYTLQFRWNARLEAWFFDVLDEAAATYLVAGVRVVVGWPLTAYRDLIVPPGQFVAIDTTNSDTDPALTDLGIRVKLYYITAEDLA